MPDRRWKLSAESITAAAAVVAALIALGIGVWENIQQRQHQRLSVFPSLGYIIELRNVDADASLQAEIQIVNDGVGPAIIDETRIRVGQPDGTERVYSTWTEAATALEAWGVQVAGHAEFREGSVFGAGRERSWVTLQLPAAEESQAAVQRFAELLERLTVTIRYHSIYRDEFRAPLPPR